MFANACKTNVRTNFKYGIMEKKENDPADLIKEEIKINQDLNQGVDKLEIWTILVVLIISFLGLWLFV